MTLENTSTSTQRLHILKCLRLRPHSTLEFRSHGICSPAPRIMELRSKGYEIITTTTTEYDHAGTKHRGIAVYQLLSEPTREQAK